MLESVFNFLQKSIPSCANPRTPFSTRGWLMTGLLLASLLVDCAGAKAGTASAPAPAVAAEHAAANYGKIPLSFEPNRGQTGASVKFLSRGSGYSLFLTKDEVVLNLERQQAATQGDKPAASQFDTLRMKLVGASATTTITGLEPQSGVVSYLIGNDPKKWHTGIETFGKVNFAQVYPGVDLVFYGNQRQLEYDFVVAPGADASRIGWQIDGAKPNLDAEGNLVLSAANGPAGFKKPVLYQMDGDKKLVIEGAFTVAGNRIGFQLGSYDHAKPLIIDPVLTYASYLGGSSTDNIGGFNQFYPSGTFGSTQALAVDSAGSIYVTGYTYSADFPTKNSYMSAHPGKMSGSDWPSIFVSKFSPDGSSLVYSTYLGGNGLDYSNAIAVNSSNEAYITGSTTSPDFPVTAGAYQTICSPEPGNSGNVVASCSSFYYASAFVAKLNSSGTGLVYATFLGGLDGAAAVAIALDDVGRAYISGNVQGYCRTGYSYTCFPTTTGAVISGSQTTGSSPQYAFISVFDPTGANLLYSTLFGSEAGLCPGNSCPDHGSPTYGTGVAVDANSGAFYLIGSTMAADLPTTSGVIQPTSGPLNPSQVDRLLGIHGLIAKFYPITKTGTTLQYATYLGGATANYADVPTGIVVDSAGYPYIDGFAASPNFPVTTGAYQTTCALLPCSAAYVAKLNPSLSTIEWATFYGDLIGSSDSIAKAGPIQLDGSGNVYIQGSTQTGGLTTVNPVEPNAGGYQETFVAKFDPTGSKLLFSTFVGNGGKGDNASYAPAGLAVDTGGNIYLAGNTTDPGLIVTPGAFMTTESDFNGQCCAYGNGFVAKISALGTATAALVVSPSPAQAGQTVTMTATVTKTATYASVPTGTITFQDGGNALGTAVTLNAAGKATYTSSTLAPRTHSLTAVYSGDSTYPAGNGAQTLVVNGLTATVKVTPSPASITTAMSLSVAVAITGSGATPTGTVTLSGGGYNSSATTLTGGGATIAIPANSLSAGSDTLSVIYSGDANYNTAAGSGTVTVTTPATPAITVTPSSNTINTATSLSVTVKVAGSGATPTGTVVLSGGGYTSTAAVLVNGSATIVIPANSLTAGSDTLTASYTPDSSSSSTYNTATGTSSAITVTATAPTITFTVPNHTYGDAPFTVSATSSSTGAVTYSLVSGPATISGSTVTLTGAGTVVLQASQAAAGNYTGGTQTATVTVAKESQTITFTAPTSPVNYGVAPITLSASSTSGLAVTFNVVSGPGTVSGSTLTVTGLGSIVVAANQAGNSNSSAATQVTQSIVVNAIGVAATPSFSPVGGTYTSAQTVSISDTTSGATIYYTTNGTTPTTSSTLYSGAITVSSTETLQAIATATGYSTSAVASAAYTISIPTNPVPAINGISPAYTNAGGAVFTLTVNGSGFIASSTVYWGTSALTTTYVNATQITAQVPAADTAAAGTNAISVQNPAPGGGTSNAWQFEVDSTSSGTTAPTITSPTETVAAGSTASYPVTMPSSVTSVSVSCLNLPSGATCSYSSTTNAVTITTSSTTPKGTYQITVVFIETVSGAASGFILLPILLVPLGFMRRKLAARGIWLTACLGLVLMATAALSIGCGSSGGAGSTTPPATHQVTSSGAVSLTIQ